MPFMSGIVVSKQLFKTLCSFELAFVFLTPTTVETGTGYRMVSCFNCYISHSKVLMGCINYFLQMSVKLIKYHLLILRQYMLHTELTKTSRSSANSSMSHFGARFLRTTRLHFTVAPVSCPDLAV